MTIGDLRGKAAVVTGGNGGIGLGIAKGLGTAGAAIVVAGRDPAKNEAAVASLRALGVDAASFVHEVTSETSARGLVAFTTERHGRLDILVNNAGINDRKPPQDYALAEWQRIIDANLTGTFICCQAAYPAMRASGGGKIINIGSMMTRFGHALLAPYAASKGGVGQLTMALACAWAKDAIQVNAILPGWIDTELTRRAREQIPGLDERVVARTPAGRWGRPEDLAGLAIFLASPAADFVTGALIPCDGGYSAQG
jgi:2-deoxy-D-gluconate 3-dehydrogenase